MRARIALSSGKVVYSAPLNDVEIVNCRKLVGYYINQ